MEPLNTPNSITHFLDFVSDGTGEIQIDEPIKFDGANFVLDQQEKRYGRDVSFAGEQIDFMFVDKITKYGHQLEKILEFRKIYGFEADIRYILKENGNSFVVGQLCMHMSETDNYSHFSCKVLQDNSQAILKRRYDIKVDLFSDEDLDGNSINPIQTSNILLKAKPIVQKSQFETVDYSYSGQFFGSQPAAQFPIFRNMTLSGVEVSYPSLYDVYENPTGEGSAADFFADARENLKFVLAQSALTNIEINISGLSLSCTWTGILDITKRFSVIWGTGYQVGEFEYHDFINTDDSTVTLNNQDYSFTIPYVPQGGYIAIIFSIFDIYTLPTTTPSSSGGLTIQEGGSLSITSTATAINSVTKGVRLIDAMNQVTESINQDFVVDAPRYENGGEWYDNFIFDGNLIRGRDTEFVMPFKEMHEHIQAEFNSDYEVTSNAVFIGKYDDFYKNVDIGSFLMSPDDTLKFEFNERYKMNAYKFKYDTYTQDRDDENTIDDVHTEQEYLLPNLQVENRKEANCPFIRSHFTLESTRLQAVATGNTSSLDNDDKKFIVDVVPLAPSARGELNLVMTHNVNSSNQLQILNDNTFNWELLGFGLGTTITLLNTDNADTYTVIAFTGNIITLEAQNITPTSINQVFTQIEHPYTNVAYTIRTNEGFDEISGVLNPNVYANLLYTQKRNILNNWGSYLKTCTKYQPSDIRQTYFKNNVPLVTQFNGGNTITENTNILQSDLSEPILTPDKIITKVPCDFSTYFNLKSAIQFYRGFIRLCSHTGRVYKAFVQKGDFVWKDGLLEITGEEKYESEYLTIENTEGYFVINEVGYDTDIVPTLVYYTDGDYIQIFDVNNRPLINKTRYDFVTVNGTAYDSIAELTAAIDALNN